MSAVTRCVLLLIPLATSSGCRQDHSTLGEDSRDTIYSWTRPCWQFLRFHAQVGLGLHRWRSTELRERLVAPKEHFGIADGLKARYEKALSQGMSEDDAVNKVSGRLLASMASSENRHTLETRVTSSKLRIFPRCTTVSLIASAKKHANPQTSTVS